MPDLNPQPLPPIREHDIDGLERALKDLKHGIDDLGSGDDLDEMLLVIHRPGWTTLAELALVSGIVESLTSQVHQMRVAKTHFTRAALLIGDRGNPNRDNPGQMS